MTAIFQTLLVSSISTKSITNCHRQHDKDCKNKEEISVNGIFEHIHPRRPLFLAVRIASKIKNPTLNTTNKQVRKKIKAKNSIMLFFP